MILGSRRGAAPGPTLVVVGGMHGNEPAGVDVGRRLLARLDEAEAEFAGEVIAIAANDAALAAGQRYLLHDLNRQFTDARVADARAAAARTAAGVATATVDPETAAVAELADEFDRIGARARGALYALDLHTTSAEGIPFAIVSDSPEGRAFAGQFPLPGILGLQERLEGVLGGYLAAHGWTALSIEGGQHQSPATIANLDAAVNLAMAAAGILAPRDSTAAATAHALLERARGDLPQFVKVVTRHEVRPGSGFRMEPGFINIQRVTAGTLLAREGDADIRAPFDGVLLLPLYQPQGTDGFFFGSDVLG